MAGGCPCGAVRYEIGAFPLLLYAYHCTDCQRETGSAFAMNMPAQQVRFEFCKGRFVPGAGSDRPARGRRPGSAAIAPAGFTVSETVVLPASMSAPGRSMTRRGSCRRGIFSCAVP